MKIDIGGGTAPAPGYINLDPVHGVDQWKARIQDGIDVDNSSCDAVRASHVLEHIMAGHERISVFNEVHRVLKSHGTFQVIVPGVGITHHAWADPTHVSYWVPESFGYFDGTIAPAADYGILPWETLDLTVAQQWEIHWLGRPIK